MSPQYAAALAAHNQAIAKFDSVRNAYRAREVGDAEFLAARAEYDAATAEYDAAYAQEAQGKYGDDESWCETQDIQAGGRQ